MPSLEHPPQSDRAGHGSILLPCLLLFGAMFNLTLVVAGLKEFILGDLGGTVADATLFFSVETFAYILFAPIWGLVSDRVGRRRPFVVCGFLVSSGLYAAYGTLQSIPLLLTLRFIQGGFSVMGWSLTMAAVLDQPGRGQRGRTMGLMGAALIFGVAMGAPVGGYITRWYGARAPLAVAAGLFLLLALAATALRDAARPTRGPRMRQILAALGARPRLALPMAFHFVDRLAVGLFVVVFPLYVDSLGASDPAVRGRYLALFLLPFAFLQYFTGKLSERTGPYPLLLAGSFFYGLLLCAVGYSGLFLLWPVMIGLGIFAAVMFPPAILLTAQLSDPVTRGSALGGFNLAGSLGFALGPLVGGAIYAARGFGAAFLFCGIVEIILALVAWTVVRRWGRD